MQENSLLILNKIQTNQISWIRRRDWHILSSGSQTYTNDERFSVLHAPGSNVWTLQIKFVQQRDSGLYECQLYGDNTAAISKRKTNSAITSTSTVAFNTCHSCVIFKFICLIPSVMLTLLAIASS
uniref:CSON004227 protein n=1 Tax=Culicoides sonorensis TaxID=179676 RepID=A0A336MUH6_CULSO